MVTAKKGNRFRVERDFLGARRVPADAYYGIETVRAIGNFPISGLRAHPSMVRAMAMIKKAGAVANRDLGRLSRKMAGAIVRACEEVIRGRLADQFAVDVFQMGAGTSFHMNVNEVIASRAAEILGGRKGDHHLVHPNDHVNLGQSTNDVYPTAMRLACRLMLDSHLLPGLDRLERTLREKGREFENVVKSGRTHLQDAAPVKLGHEFRAYASAVAKCRQGISWAGDRLLALGIGGSAVGTGVNTTPGYREAVIAGLAAQTCLRLRPAADLQESMQSLRPFVEVSASLRTLAVELTRIANDLRLLGSGPRTGLGEIAVPAVAPGSSIMPGKVNPSMLEMANMVGYQVMGCDQAVAAAAQAGQLELNVMMPVVAFNLGFMIEILGNALRELTRRCIAGITANADRCREYAEKSLGLATATSPRIGYACASELAREAGKRGLTIREILEEKGDFSPAEIRDILDLEKLSEPVAPRRKRRNLP
ncbi:MAG: aspartate ammonia-lyase [Candidatus Aminicenantes bacterium RBG_16_63_16]|nr:MAG: aspartate ammonia-lyase [Candidatus Aminicenantes bacterium RBG_16_63_16]